MYIPIGINIHTVISTITIHVVMYIQMSLAFCLLKLGMGDAEILLLRSSQLLFALKIVSH